MRRVGMLERLPIVEGDENTIGYNQILKKNKDSEVSLYKRDSTGKLQSITGQNSTLDSNNPYYQYYMGWENRIVEEKQSKWIAVISNDDKTYCCNPSFKDGGLDWEFKWEDMPEAISNDYRLTICVLDVSGETLDISNKFIEIPKESFEDIISHIIGMTPKSLSISNYTIPAENQVDIDSILISKTDTISFIFPGHTLFINLK